jgi:imidazolonepropionase-like amidohydrolase/Tol biopolymer transport system component
MVPRVRHSFLAVLSLITLLGATAADSQQDPPPPEPAPADTEPPDPEKVAEPAKADDEDKEKDDEKDKWKVDKPPFPYQPVKLDVDEGTWMSVDVSPDGREIVFDLLGDLYVVPIGGGDAKALTRGIAWDEQPRYSPDGRWIAFTSDRAGGDNLWVMERAGKKPTQVTKESFRLLNSPAWTPDSEFIAGRKHFTSTRSAGAGEVWLYHRSGGDGVQMTARPNDQKDLGEPAFSPDGRYLYYSQDTTPGSVFQYNKDPNGQIYVIQRLDRQSGEVEVFVNGPGGSIRPTPSPDGKSLAFLRRIRGKTVLHVRDLASGRDRAVFDGMERDLQEAWAIHGVYPGISWTPDSRAIVAWAGGKIRRIDAATGQATVIPFRVQDTRDVAAAVRFPVEVAPEKFPLRMLRGVQVSPRGDRVVYEALGSIWIRSLPEGAPRRLTTQSDHFELQPSFSRDGASVVYATWDDQAAGTVRIVPAAGGVGRIVSPTPGHYLEPAFSPDGRTVVYRRIAGGFTRTPLWSSDLGVFSRPLSAGNAGAERLLSRTATQPHFGAASDRVYFLEPQPEDKRALVSSLLDGADRRVHATSAAATDFRVSPDERWIAFRERYQVYVTPFARSGKTIAIGPKATALPVARVSKDSGDYLSWAGDSRALHWALGPELFTRDLKDAFAFIAGAPEELPGPAEKGVDIGSIATADQPRGATAVVGGTVITMRGDEVLRDAVVLVEGNRIRAVGPRGSVAVPPGARTVDATGKFVLPGYIDVHWHGSMGDDGIVPERNWVEDASLAFGVTTVHDPSNDTHTVFAASEMQRAGRIVAPRLYSTGTILYGAEGDFKVTIDSLDDARAHLERLRAAGAFSVKSYNQPRREQRQQVLAAARELEMLVVPEGGSLFPHNMTMVIDGHTGVEHSLPQANVYADVVQLWSQTEVGYTPTLGVAYGGLSGEFYWYAKTDVWADPRLSRFVPREILDARSRRRQTAPDGEWNHIDAARVADQLSRAGVSVQIGAHGQREGLAAHWEMWMLVQGGMTPHRALRAATIDGARYLGMDRDLGSIEPGKLADLLVLDADPLADIGNSRTVRTVMLNGRLYDGETLDEIGGAKRPPAYWQDGGAAPTATYAVSCD